MKFKVGYLVKCISVARCYSDCKEKIGRIICIHQDGIYTVEFFKPVIGGHSGFGYGDGKLGQCRWFNEEEIELYHPILKIFLKEKKQ